MVPTTQDSRFTEPAYEADGLGMYRAEEFQVTGTSSMAVAAFFLPLGTGPEITQLEASSAAATALL